MSNPFTLQVLSNWDKESFLSLKIEPKCYDKAFNSKFAGAENLHNFRICQAVKSSSFWRFGVYRDLRSTSTAKGPFIKLP